MITTTKGLMEESTLHRVDGIMDNDNERTTWVEYYLKTPFGGKGELVHRSAHVTLKKWPEGMSGIAAPLG